MLLIMIHLGFMAKVVNVKTAFLYGEPGEEIYRECPPGMKDITTDICVFCKIVFMALCKKLDSTTKRLQKSLEK